MHILFLTPYVPTPIRTRPYNLLKALAGRGHRLTLLCVAQGEGLWATRLSPLEERALEELRALGVRCCAVLLPRLRSLWNCLRALPSPLPLQAAYCWSPALARLLRDEVRPTPSSRPASFSHPVSCLPNPDPFAPSPAPSTLGPAYPALDPSSSAPGPEPSALSPEPSSLSPEPYALLHIEHLRAAHYGLWLQKQTRLSIPIVWDSVDCISYLFEQSARASRSAFGRLVTRLELPRTRRYEALLLRRFARTLVTSPADAAALSALPSEPPGPHALRPEPRAPHPEPYALSPEPYALSPEPYALPPEPYALPPEPYAPPPEPYAPPPEPYAPLPEPYAPPPEPRAPHPEPYAPRPEPFILPNGVDLAYFHPNETPRRPEVVFSGKMSYHANTTAALYLAQEVMPRVWQRRPDVHLTIVGSRPPRAVRALSGERVTVTDYVEDIRPFLWRAALAVAPMPYGAGIQNKVLEAMACATPVVATPQAVSALTAQPGRHLLVGKSADELAGHILYLLEHPEAAGAIGRAGRAYVEQSHDWQVVAQRLEHLYEEETARHFHREES